MDALAETATPAWRGEISMEERLRGQMQADMLVPLNDDGKDADPKSAPWAPETIEEAAQFLCLNVSACSFLPLTKITDQSSVSPWSV
jgi:hypothetical protein